MLGINNNIKRRKSREISLKGFKVGGNQPIWVQTMTNTKTIDIQGTIAQIKEVEKLGVDIIRISCPDEESALALRTITKSVSIPIIADIHFHYKLAVLAAENGASCLRFNPGNIGNKERIKTLVQAAKRHNCAIRIGVNAGSLEKDLLLKYQEPNADALVESAMRHIGVLEEADFTNFKISLKSSDVMTTVEAYEKLSKLCDYPFHLGITEAGSFMNGTIKSSMGLGHLLMQGIGDTLRVSLSSHISDEVKVGFGILKALHLRAYGLTLISCPSCARQQFNVIQVVQQVEKQLEHIKNPITLAILGCVVNGPGESKMTDIGFVGGGNQMHQIYLKGHPYKRFKGNEDDVVKELVDMVNNFDAHYSKE